MTAPATPAQVTEIKRLAEAATESPWVTGNVYGTADGTEILFGGGCIGDTGASTCGKDEDLANAYFIAACREAVPALIALIEAQYREIEEGRERTAKILAKWSKPSQIRLAAGEITRGEMWCVRTVVAAIATSFTEGS